MRPFLNGKKLLIKTYTYYKNVNFLGFKKFILYYFQHNLIKYEFL